MKKYEPNFEALDRLTKEGYLRKVVSPCGKLFLYNYTDHCTFDKHWNKHTLNARGTVYEVGTGKIVAQAFPKFFNFGELPSSKSRNLLKQTDFEVYEKMDGSLGIVYFYNGKWRVNTRGSFTSDQAIKATEMLGHYNQDQLNKHITYLVEIIYPENRIIVDYGKDEELYLLASFNAKDGHEIDLELNVIQKCPFVIAPSYEFNSIQDIIDKQQQLGKMEEGFVVRFANGERVKFKSIEYLKVAKILSNMTPLNFWRSMENGLVRSDILEEIPEEFRAESDKIQKEIEHSYNKLKGDIEEDFEYCSKAIGYDYEVDDFQDFCKSLGLFLKEQKLKHSGAMFSRLKQDFKALDKYIMKEIRPTGNKVVE